MHIFVFNTQIKSLTGKFKRNIDDGEILNITFNKEVYNHGLYVDDKKVLWNTFAKSLSSEFNIDIQQLRDGNIMLNLKVEKMRYGIKLVVVSVSEKPKQITLERLKYLEYNLNMFSMPSEQTLEKLESHQIIGLTESEINEFKEAVQQVFKYKNIIKKILNTK